MPYVLIAAFSDHHLVLSNKCASHPVSCKARAGRALGLAGVGVFCDSSFGTMGPDLAVAAAAAAAAILMLSLAGYPEFPQVFVIVGPA